MIRMRPDDDYFLCLHSASTPMQIGALMLFDVPDAQRHRFSDLVREHLAHRLPATALARVRRSAPWHIDCDAWFDLAEIRLDDVVSTQRARVTLPQLHQLVAALVMEQVDPDKPPFRMVIVPEIEGGGSAIFLTTLHALADGIGFQSITESLTDPTATPQRRPPVVRRNERIPTTPEWLVRASVALGVDAWKRYRSRDQRASAQAALDAHRADPSNKRAKTPQFELSAPTSALRSYTTMSLPLPRVKAVAVAMGGTVNDVFLATAAGAVRSYLISIDALPPTPIVVNAARSYRRSEHGELGNRIVSLHPHLATTIADPVQRFRAIQASMASELERSRLQEPLMDQGAKPFSARKQREAMSQRVESGGAVLPGNVSLSNVPGPSATRYLAGFAMKASYPAPILGAGRFLNITLRRYLDHLDLGVMTDAAKISDASVLRGHLANALDELEQIS
ncbi:MAG: wax ester/triacylglycerol synthase domain-containing protein [Acidimicrobiia bacterium]